MAHMTVVRNQAYTRAGVGIRERHNERKNECYSNADIRLDRSPMNVHFRECEGTYIEAFDKLLSNGIISTRGQRADAKIIDEMVFDVNTSYFEENGGYDFAKQFFEEAYQLAIKEAGDERYILSAIMHADEVNKAVSEELGRDVFHYHLHVTYIPVVEKEVLWTKRCKDPELVGKVKEVINQVSHSKKWPRFKGESGAWINSYSLLQDRFYQHMKDAGFQNFERGERGSTAEHLTDLEYKTKKEAERAEAMATIAAEKENAVAVLDEKVAKKTKRLDELDKKIAPAKKAAATIESIERLGDKRTIMGDVPLSPTNWEKLLELAKEGLKSRSIIEKLKNTVSELKEQISGLLKKIFELEKKLESYEGSSLTEKMKYYQAMQRAPHRLAETVNDIMRQPPEKTEKLRQMPQQGQEL